MEEKQQSSGFGIGKAFSAWLGEKRPNDHEELDNTITAIPAGNTEIQTQSDDQELTDVTTDRLALPESLRQAMHEFAEQHWRDMVNTADSKVRDYVDQQLADAAEAVEQAKKQAANAAENEAKMRDEWNTMRETLNRQTAELEDANERVVAQSKSLNERSETITELQDTLSKREAENARRADAFDKHLEEMRSDMAEREIRLNEEFAEKETRMQESIAAVQGKLQLRSSDLEEANTRNAARSSILEKKDAELAELKAVHESFQQQADLDLRKLKEQIKDLQADSQRREEDLKNKLSKANTDLKSRTGDLISKLKSTEIQLNKQGNDFTETEAVAEWQSTALKEKDAIITKIQSAAETAANKSNTLLNALHNEMAMLTQKFEAEQARRSEAESKAEELDSQLSEAREGLRASERSLEDANAELARKSEKINENSKVVAGLNGATYDEALPERIAELEQDNSILLTQLTEISEAGQDAADGIPDLAAIRNQLLRGQTELRQQNELLLNAKACLNEKEKELEARNREIDELNDLLQSKMAG